MPFNAQCPGCGATDPCGCSDPYSDKTSSTDVKYVGQPLTGAGINTCDDLTTIIQKLDYAITQLQAAITPTTTTTTTTP